MYARTTAMEFIASKLTISSRLNDLSNPSSAFFVALIAVNRIAISTGKLRTAIKMLLLFALEAMPEMRLREAANPIEVSTSNVKKRRWSCTGLLRNTMNNR